MSMVHRGSGYYRIMIVDNGYKITSAISCPQKLPIISVYLILNLLALSESSGFESFKTQTDTLLTQLDMT